MKNNRFERLEKRIEIVFLMVIMSFGFTLVVNGGAISTFLGIVFGGYGVINLFSINKKKLEVNKNV